MDTSTISVVIKAALDYAYAQDPAFMFGTQRSEIEQQMQEALATVLPTEVNLSVEKPDYESIYLRLVQELQTDNAWYDAITAGTGQTILRNIVSGISYALFAIERATQESFLHSAKADSSVFMAARMLGVRPRRRIPATVSVRFTRPDNTTGLSIPAFTEFSINKTTFFNRDDMLFNEFELTKDFTLVQGTVITLEAIAEGNPFERIEFGAETGLISDEDVYVYVNGVEWTRKINVGPFNFGRNEECFYESTLPNTNVEVQFGNKAFGKIPTAGASILIRWAETEGSNANEASSGLVVSLSTALSGVELEGITLGPIQNGNEALTASFYRTMSPHVRAANKRAVRRSDYRGVALEYPGVVDARFRGQAELNPGKRNWMNVIGATILMRDGTVMTDSQWSAFVKWMQENISIYQCEFVRIDPVPALIDISGKIYCKQNSNLTLIKQDLLKNITTQFGPRANVLGYSLYASDISDLLEGTGKYDDAISYCTNVLPSGDTIVSDIEWVKINSVSLEMLYTTRDGYMGRLDLIPPTGA